MRICVLISGFPSKKSAGGIFVVKLCEEMARLGHQITIISPQSLAQIVTGKDDLSKTSFIHKTSTGECIKVLRPIAISFSNIPILKKVNGYFRSMAVKKAVAAAGEQDVYYGHFWENGYSLYRAINRLKKPLFVASGESIIRFRTNEKAFSKYVSGVICVSTKNLEESIAAGLTTKDKCLVVPNAIDNAVFYEMNKQECRHKLGINDKLFVVAYVGQFIQRKGYERVAEAIDSLNDKNIGVVFLGSAKEGKSPQCNGILKCGLVPQNEIPQYLNASDVFVLPTRAEGCCNAIVEAMACGLPIVSSDRPFNYDILDKSNSILIQPDEIGEIAAAIQNIKSNPKLQATMHESSLKKAQDLNLVSRTKKIISFIQEKIV